MIELTEESFLFVMASKYVNGEISTRALEDWLVPRLEGFIVVPRPSVREVLGTIELGLAELSEGHLTEDAFRSRVRDVLTSTASVMDTISTSAILVRSVSGSGNVSANDPTQQFSYTAREVVPA